MQPDQIAVDIRWLNQKFLLWVKAEAGRDPYDIHLRTGMPLPAISRLINMPITEVANRASETVLQFRVRFPDSWWNDITGRSFKRSICTTASQPPHPLGMKVST